MPVSSKLHVATGRAKPLLKLAGKLVLLTALRYGPAGVAGWLVKSVAHRPVKMLLALVLEPALNKFANQFAARYSKKRMPGSR